MHSHFLLALLAFPALGCGSQSPTPDTAPKAVEGAPAVDLTAKFLGKWTYEPGSVIVVDCASAPQQTLDLSSVPPTGQPGYFSLAASAPGTVHEVDARGCQYDWDIAGDVATAQPGQNCQTFPDGHGGNRPVQLQSGTKTLSDGASIIVDVNFTSDTPESCGIHVQGSATKS